MENKNVDFKELSGAENKELNGVEKILLHKTIETAQRINQNGPACSYKENMDLYDSIKNVTMIFNKHDATFNYKKVLCFE